MIVQGFHFGFDESGLWRKSWRGFDPPDLFEDRWELGMVPFVKNLGRERVDVVYIGHFEWDIQVRSLSLPTAQAHETSQSWVEQPLFKTPSFTSILPSSNRTTTIYHSILDLFMPLLRPRIIQAISILQSTYPEAQIIWRMPHDIGGRGPLPSRLGQVVDQILRDVFVGDTGSEVALDPTAAYGRGAWEGEWMADGTHLAKVSLP